MTRPRLAGVCLCALVLLCVASCTNQGYSLYNETVEASCGQCQFNMEGDGCDLAIRHNGRTMFVDGSNIDDHGDAHADDGLCNCVRRALVTGHIKEHRFQSERMVLLGRADRANED